MNSAPKIIVAIRKRPVLKRELLKNETDIVQVRSDSELTVTEERAKVDLTPYIEEHRFSFDAVFDENSDNQKVYDTLLKPLVANAFDRAKINVFAYGQTGSGKTFTMMGSQEEGVFGLYLLSAKDIFAQLGNYDELEQTVGISFYEIYCGKAYDLLNERAENFIRVDAKDNVNIVGLTEKKVSNTQSLMALIRIGLSSRITGVTGMNDESSRSHAILSISLRSVNGNKLWGRLSFIDLAGSERGADVTGTNKQTRFDGAEINKSLLALKECIRAMDLDKKYLPFRGSKLTMVLKDSFVGNSATVMIGNISPSIVSCEHTLNTLRYADRVKELKKGAKTGNESKDSKDQLARQLMLPRMNKNSNKISFPERTVEESIVFESFDVQTGMGIENFRTINRDKKVPLSSTIDNFRTRQSSKNRLFTKKDSRAGSLSRENSSTADIQKSVRPLSIGKQEPPKSASLHIEKEKSSRQTLPLPKPQEMQKQKIKLQKEMLHMLSHQQEDLIDEHSNHIDAIVGCVKEDMAFLQEVKDSPTEILHYIHQTKNLLAKKMESILRFQRKLQKFEVDFQALEGYDVGPESTNDDMFSLNKDQDEENVELLN